MKLIKLASLSMSRAFANGSKLTLLHRGHQATVAWYVPARPKMSASGIVRNALKLHWPAPLQTARLLLQPLGTGPALLPGFERSAARRGVSVSAASEESTAFEEVAWNPELVNSTYLLGRTGQDLEIRYLENGQIIGKVSLAVNTAHKDGPMWVNLEIWGPLAERVAAQIPKGTKVAIQGQLRISKWTDSSGKLRTSTSVAVNQLKTVRPMESAPGPSQSRQGAGTSSNSAAPKPGSSDLAERWQEYFENPSAYADFRQAKQEGKVSPRHPDFKHKQTKDALWIDSYGTPQWVKASLQKFDELQEEGGGDMAPF
mmetsp:Transcript_32877/g.77977  ORF Transcript_32877/g.77977 Transcript_32877/m.77977 type:complete len:314 (+) Transcript_32877:93-1034(+)